MEQSISLLFLTYNNPIHTKEWNSYLNNKNFNFLIHPKYPENITSPWNNYLSSKNIETSWGKDSIIRATLNLLKEALELHDSNWFILCSEDSFPLLTPDKCLDYFKDKELSIFHPIDENNPSKVSQWFAMSKNDVISIVNSLRIDSAYNIQNKQLYNSIIQTIPNKAAVDELFFIPLLKQINSNYKYDVGLIHYVKWIPNWVSKHPTTFNRLLAPDKNAIQENNALFIRKTFPTFKNLVIQPKFNAVIITIGTKNVKSINYDGFLNKIKHTHDLYLLVMIDSMSEISDKLKSNCIQAYSVVWSMIDKAYENIASSGEEVNSVKSLVPHYNEVIILKEDDNPYDYFPGEESDDIPFFKYKPYTPESPPPPPSLQTERPKSPEGPPPLSLRTERPKSPEGPPPPPLRTERPKSQKENISSVEYNPDYKIAYLFLLRADINHPEIWSKYFVSDSDENVSKYVHSKEKDNIKTPWIRDALIDDIKPTGWGYIVDAYFSLFRKAMEDPNNLKFVLISESCVPVKNYYEFKNYLNRGDYRNSYVHFLPSSPWDVENRIQNQPNYQQFGKFTKHYARMCLSRYHVEKLLSQPKSRIDFFINMHVGDEFFLTMINAKPNEDYMVDKTITYDNWDYVNEQVRKIKREIKQLKDRMMRTKNKNLENEITELENKMNDIRKNPRTYDRITSEDIEDVFDSGAFFWRKFPSTISLELYYDNYGALRQIKKRGGTRKRKYKMKKTKKNKK